MQFSYLSAPRQTGFYFSPCRNFSSTSDKRKKSKKLKIASGKRVKFMFLWRNHNEMEAEEVKNYNQRINSTFYALKDFSSKLAACHSSLAECENSSVSSLAIMCSKLYVSELDVCVLSK
jgi:hypothetical protein